IGRSVRCGIWEGSAFGQSLWCVIEQRGSIPIVAALADSRRDGKSYEEHWQAHFRGSCVFGSRLAAPARFGGTSLLAALRQSLSVIEARHLPRLFIAVILAKPSRFGSLT